MKKILIVVLCFLLGTSVIAEEVTTNDSDYTALAKKVYLEDSQNYEQALNYLDKSLLTNKNDTQALYYQALIYGERGEHKQAIAKYNKLIKNNKTSWILYFNRGTERINIGGDYLYGAVSDLKKAQQLNPTETKIKQNYEIATKLKKDYLMAGIKAGAIGAIMSLDNARNAQVEHIDKSILWNTDF